jgi:hypothetical protein
MYHEPKIQVVEISSPQKKKSQPKKNNKHNFKDFLESVAMVIGFIGAFWAIGSIVWDKLGPYIPEEKIVLHALPGFVLLGICVLMHLILDRRG